MRETRWLEVIVLVLLFTALFLPIPGRFRAPWTSCMQDLAHVPLFAGLAWTVARVSGGRIIAAAVLSLAVAVLAELLQMLVGRSASLADLARGICGIAIYVGWDLAGKHSTGWRRNVARLTSLVVGMALPLAAAWPMLTDSIYSWRQFPVLADFSSPWQDRRWFTQGCRLTCRPGTAETDGVGILRFEPAGQAECSAILFPIRRDWSAWRSANIKFTVAGGPLPITFSVRDGRRVTPPRRRFDRCDIFQNGRHQVSIDLAEISRGTGEVAPVRVDAVESLHLIVDAQGAGRDIHLHRVWLE
jgi:hypothetical protein